MKLINDLLDILEDKSLVLEFAELENAFTKLKLDVGFLISEGLVDSHNGPLEADFDRVEKMYMAARRALGISSKLKDPAKRSQVKGDIIRKMNAIRKELYDLMIKLDMDADEQGQNLDRIKQGDIRNRDPWGNVGAGGGGRTFAAVPQNAKYTQDQEAARRNLPNIHRKTGTDPNLPSGRQAPTPNVPPRRRSFFGFGR